MSKVRLTEQAAPPTPPTDKGEIYIKTDGILYFKNDAGSESDLTSIGGNSFGIVTGDSGTATSDSVNDTLTITGGEGIVTTASDSPEDVNIVIDLSEFSTDTGIASGDLIVFRDISPAANNLITWANLQAAIVIVGTITTGTWQGDVIDHERGGLESDVSTGDGFVEIKGGSTTIIKSNQAASTAPGTGNDNTESYSIGSIWIDTTADKAYVALDVSTGAAVWTETTQTGGGGGTAGKNTIWIPASAMTPAISSPCADLEIDEMGISSSDIHFLSFDNGNDEHAQFSISFPKKWNAGTLTFLVHWSVNASVSTGVAWNLGAHAISDNETLDGQFNGVVVTDDAQSGIDELLITAESTALTVDSSPTSDSLIFFRITRDVSDGNDDMSQDARLLGIKLFWTSDAENDD